MKGQVSTEYLVILAVVLVVALVVVALVSGVTPVSGGVSETQSKNYWSATAPFVISGWKYQGVNLQLTMQNMDGQKVTLSDFKIDGTSYFSTSTNTSFTVGETKSITATGLTSCGSSGDSFELSNIQITYGKGSITGLLQKGAKSLVGTCS